MTHIQKEDLLKYIEALPESEVRLIIEEMPAVDKAALADLAKSMIGCEECG